MAKKKTQRYKEFKERLEKNRTKYRRREFTPPNRTDKHERETEKDIKTGIYYRGY